MRTLTNISAATILQALRKAKPLTAVGRAAVENYRAYLVKNPMCAIALENSILDLTGNKYDPGLESLVTTLKGMMPESQRKVAVAYEALSIDNENAGIFAAPEAAFEALNSLYNMNSAKIVDAINGGALDSYKTVPTIAKLVRWAKSAQIAEPERKVIASDSAVSTELVPVLSIATVADGAVVCIDNKCYIQGNRGQLTPIASINELENIPSEVRALMQCLSVMHNAADEPNVLLFNDDVLESLRKTLPISKFGIDLLAGINELVQLNDTAMSAEKAMAILSHSSDELIAALAINDAAKDALQLVNTAMTLFEKYRGVISSGTYATKFKNDRVAVYVIEYNDSTVSVAQAIDGNVVNTKSFSSVFDALSSEIFISNPGMYDAAAIAFASSLKDDAKKMSVRKKIAMQLADERKQYEDLLARINSEIDELAQVIDANPDKVKALGELRDKTTAKIAAVVDELNKLMK